MGEVTLKAVKLAAVLSVLAAPCAFAEPINLVRQTSGYTYFNRPGSSMDEHNAALTTCRGGARPGGPSNFYGPGLLASAMEGQIAETLVENCMVVEGWRVVRLSDDEGARLARLPPAELSKVLAEWVGAQTPAGDVVRIWQNDAARPGVITSMMPGLLTQTSLSGRALTTAPRPPAGSGPMVKQRPFKLQVWSDSKASKLEAATAGEAVLVLTLRNSAPQNWTRMALQRLGPDSATEAWAADGNPDIWYLAIPKSLKRQPSGSVSQTFAAVLPPGRWAFAMISDVTSTCLGAPFFDVEAGEVVYAGAIDFGKNGLPIDLDLTPARARLAQHADLATKVRSASWINGASFRCVGYGYALEYSDLPYAKGYRRAGAR